MQGFYVSVQPGRHWKPIHASEFSGMLPGLFLPSN